MKIEKAIEELSDLALHPSMKKSLSIPCIASCICALTEQKQRGEGCEYCENVPSRYKGITAEAFEQIAADDEHVVEIDVKYCPMCGKRLGENDE